MFIFSAIEGVSHRNRTVCFKTELFNVVWISKMHLLVYGLSAIKSHGAHESWTLHLDIKGG